MLVCVQITAPTGYTLGRLTAAIQVINSCNTVAVEPDSPVSITQFVPRSISALPLDSCTTVGPRKAGTNVLFTQSPYAIRLWESIHALVQPGSVDGT